MKNLNDCKETGTGESFSKTEKRKTFVLQSNKKFACEVVDIDDCVLKEEEIRKCDWLFLVPNKDGITNKPKAYYVELKGINIDEACEQLYNAIDRTKNQIPNFEIEARVISPKGPQPEITNSTYYRKVRRIIKKDIEFCKVHKGNNFTHVEKI